MDELIAQLNSPDPGARRQAIIALGRAADPRALSALGSVYRNDPLPELRELALKAGRYIRQHQQNRQPPPQPQPSAPPFAAAPPPDQAGAQAYPQAWQEASRLPTDVAYGTGLRDEVSVSARDVERAKAYYNRALDLYMAGDRPKAAAELSRALEINPNLVNDLPTRNLAGEVTGLPPEQAARALADPEQRDRFLYPPEAEGAGRKRKRGAALAAATWGDVTIDLGLLFLVVVIGTLAYQLFVFPRMLDALFVYTASSPGPYQAVEDILQVAASPVAAFGIALAVGAFNVVYVLLGYGLINWVARMFGGRGALLDLYHALVPVAIVLSLAYYVIYALNFLVLDVTSPWQGLVALLSLGLGIGGLYWTVRQIGRVHDLDAGTGCATLFLGGLLMVVVLCVCGLLVNFALGAALFPFFTASGP